MVSSFDQASKQFKETAAKAGISGDAVIDAHLNEGFIRMKLRWSPAERGVDLTKGLAETVSTVLQMMGIQVKIKVSE